MTTNNNKLIIWMCVLINTSLFAKDLITPALPTLAKTMHTSNQSLQLAAAFFVLATGLSQYCFALISDNYSRRGSLLLGLGLSLLATLIIIFTNSINLFTAAFFISGLGFGSLNVNARSILADHYQGEKLTASLATLSMSTSFSPLIAPALGGALVSFFSPKAGFILTLLLIISAFLFKPSSRKKEHDSNNPSEQHLFRSKRQYFSLILISAISFSYFILFYLSTPFVFQNHMQISATTNGLLYGLIAIAYFLGSMTTKQLCKKYPSKHILTLTLTINILACMTNSIYAMNSPHALIYTLLFCLSIFSIGVITPIIKQMIFSQSQNANAQSISLSGAMRACIAFFLVIFISSFTSTSLVPLSYLLLALSVALLLLLIPASK